MSHSASFRPTGTFALVALATGGALAAPDFGPATNYAAPARPSVSTLADFDGDGDTDIAVTTDNPDKISIFFNVAGQFNGAPVNILTGAGTGADSVVSADIDGDGDADLLVVLKNSQTVRVYLNNGLGAFTAGASLAVGDRPQGLVVTDRNGDGVPDFALVNRNDNTMMLIDYSAGVLSAVTLPTGNEPRAVAFGRFNADGFVDMVVTNHDDATVSVRLNDGSGGFGPATSYSVGGVVKPDGVATGDLDGDGDIDFAVTTGDANLGLSFVSIFLNSGNGTFTGPTNISTLGQNGGALAIADLDMDGDNDIAVVNQDSSTLALLGNNGAGGFAVVQPLTQVGAGAGHLSLGMLDGNVSLDAVVTNRDAGTVSVVMNLSTPPVVACGPADVGGTGASAGFDGLLNNNDFIVYIDRFFAGNASADIGTTGGVPGADGQFDNNDFIVFIDWFFAGC